MSRRSRAQRVLSEPDPIYNSRLVTLLVSRILQSGKKSLAQKIVYNALEIISNKTEENPVLILEKAAVVPIADIAIKRNNSAVCFISPIILSQSSGANTPKGRAPRSPMVRIADIMMNPIRDQGIKDVRFGRFSLSS